MLDKSVPEKSIIMRLSAEKAKALETPRLPDGFILRAFEEGDQYRWAEIEAAVGEFPDKNYALAYFLHYYYRPRHKELRDRCFFIVRDNIPVATATAWSISGQPSLHWLAVQKDCQHIGLGRVVLSAALERLSFLHPDRDIYVHTRTWSREAVCLYHSVGFNMLKTGTAARIDGGLHKNEYYEAMKILKETIPPEIYGSLLTTAI